MGMGLIFKLDIGPLQISSRTACQRYRQHTLDATVSDRVAMIKELVNSKLNFSFNTLQTA
jgi:hypothetical protein